MAELPHLPTIESLSPRVIRILGGNPSKYTLQGTNTYLIGTSSERILIDTGEGKPSWLESLQKVLSSENASISKILLTHWHPDHIGGIADALSLPSAKDAQVYKSQLDAGTVHIADGQKRDYSPSTNQQDIVHDQTFQVEGATLTAFHCPGHTVDHMGFFLREENSALFAGDNVLGHGTAVFEDLSAYMSSLARMREAIPSAARIYPGHGAVVERGREKIEEYIAHREQRERQVLDVLRGEDAAEGWTSMGIVKVVYREYPEHLHGPAERGVVQVLRKMEGDGRVVGGEDGRWKLNRTAAL